MKQSTRSRLTVISLPISVAFSAWSSLRLALLQLNKQDDDLLQVVRYTLIPQAYFSSFLLTPETFSFFQQTLHQHCQITHARICFVKYRLVDKSRECLDTIYPALSWSYQDYQLVGAFPSTFASFILRNHSPEQTQRPSYVQRHFRSDDLPVTQLRRLTKIWESLQYLQQEKLGKQEMFPEPLVYPCDIWMISAS
jgi:hypothetical protein